MREERWVLFPDIFRPLEIAVEKLLHLRVFETRMAHFVGGPNVFVVSCRVIRGSCGVKNSTGRSKYFVWSIRSMSGS